MVSHKLKLLVVLGDGGHTAEIVRLVEYLGPDYDYAYLITTSDRISESKITIQGPIYHTMRPRAKDDKVWRVAWKLVHSFCRAAWLLYQIRPAVVLGSGPAVMVPIALLGKLVGARVIFVETGSRVTALSLTGKIMLRMADLFFVQWEQLQKRHPQTIFAGRLL
jgi:UDP-N-acetylglucosamine:LPS N-acetylglucosamine transferase